MRALQRCGNWDNGTNARAGLMFYCYHTPTNVSTGIGFRAALAVGTL